MEIPVFPFLYRCPASPRVRKLRCPMCKSERVVIVKRGFGDVRCLSCGYRWVLTL